RATAGPAYPPDEADLRDVRVAGLDLPGRATVALFATTALVLLDYTGAWRPLAGLLPQVGAYDVPGTPVAVERFVLYGVVPVLIVALGFRDRLARYGLRLGDWRWGAGLLLAGLAIMTPIILGLSRLPSFAGYYGARGGPFVDVLAGNALELFPAEFLLRGFLLFALLRRMGPLALVVVQIPFVFAHVGKPDLELWSTFIGGSIFAWLDWRTGSILWSALGHLYVLTLMLVAVGAAT
ncbi:MAG TPA: CPBP family intramembrane glutamic endopeptidase, partial [Candidatus Limnocylindrales bacterium]